MTTMLVSDHPHLFETGGENYHTDFAAWDYVRGHEGDPWRTRPDPSCCRRADAARPRGRRAGAATTVSRTWFRDEADFPGPRTMMAAAEWLDRELTRGAPARRAGPAVRRRVRPARAVRHARAVGDSVRPRLGGRAHHLAAVHAGDGDALVGTGAALTEREGRHVRAQYGAKLSMIDHWFGRILDVVDRHDAWSTTAVILCTDHGHYLGERDMWGKPAVAVHPELGHIPLLVAWPGVAAAEQRRADDHRRPPRDALRRLRRHARAPHARHVARAAARGHRDLVREWALCGVWGREVHVADRTRTYARAPVDGNRPLSMWSNRWSTMPVRALPQLRLPRPDSPGVARPTARARTCR